jgi:DNA-binding MarR family transcriptional regulator
LARVPQPSRDHILSQLQGELARCLSAGLLFHRAVADRADLSLVELKCLGLVSRGHDVTAGEIAHETQLSTSAITRMLDRLEESGWIVRERDPRDRRRSLVRMSPHRPDEIGPFYAGVSAGWAEALADYADAEITLLLGLLSRVRAVIHAQADLVRSGDGLPAPAA